MKDNPGPSNLTLQPTSDESVVTRLNPPSVQPKRCELGGLLAVSHDVLRIGTTVLMRVPSGGWKSQEISGRDNNEVSHVSPKVIEI